MTEIKKVAGMGGGVMGAQIVFQLANHGFDVTLWDINDEALAAADKRLESYKERYVKDVDSATEQSVNEARERITLTTSIEEAVGEADVVIESVIENLDIKKDVWAKIGAAAPEHAILATNTSTLLPSDFADSTGRPEDFLSFHFCTNPWVYNVVEVMPTEQTRPELADAMMEFGKEMGQAPIRIQKEQPGYVMNSLLVPFLLNALELWVKGVADIENIDRCWRGINDNTWGPFEFMDIIGLRVMHEIVAGLDENWAEEAARRLQEDYIDKNKTGWEDGAGFYEPCGPDRPQH